MNDSFKAIVFYAVTAATVLLLLLKLVHIWAVPWVWVVGPLWVPVAILMLLYFLALFLPNSPIGRSEEWGD
jgi:hypothetical protein